MVPGDHPSSQTGLALMPELGLSEEQRGLIIASAQGVPLPWRQRFMAAVADLLTMNPRPTNRAVINACAAARRAITLGVGFPAIGDD
jgi:hypothetical protein